MNRRFSILDGGNRRCSALDGTPLNAQDPEGVPSHRCLILDQSFEALKSARSSTEAMRRVQQEMERVVDTEGEKNRQYKENAAQYTSFSDEIDHTNHGMNSLMSIATDHTGHTTPTESENAQHTEDSQDCEQKEKHKKGEDDTWKTKYNFNKYLYL